jgi:hypothetical protein
VSSVFNLAVTREVKTLLEDDDAELDDELELLESSAVVEGVASLWSTAMYEVFVASAESGLRGAARLTVLHAVTVPFLDRSWRLEQAAVARARSRCSFTYSESVASDVRTGI